MKTNFVLIIKKLLSFEDEMVLMILSIYQITFCGWKKKKKIII